MSPLDKAPGPSDPLPSSSGLSDQTSASLARETTTPLRRFPPVSRPQEQPGAGRRLVSLQEAAVVLGVSVATLRRMIWAGKLPIVRLTRRLQVDVRDLDRLVERGKEGRSL
jgi:excisionase family DNA binding protein